MQTQFFAKLLIVAAFEAGFAAFPIRHPAVAAPPADKVLLAPHRAI